MGNEGSDDCAREVDAVYAFRGLQVEVERTFPMEAGESVILAGAVARAAGPLEQKPCYVRLSGDRLCILEHFGAKADRATEIPKGALRDATLSSTLVGPFLRPSVTLTWETCGHETRTMTLLPGSKPTLVTPNLHCSSEQFLEAITEWRNGGGTTTSETPAY